MGDCPTCGGPVRVVGKTTQHYEPLGVDPGQLLAVIRLLGPDEITPTAKRHLEALAEGYSGNDTPIAERRHARTARRGCDTEGQPL